MTQRRWKISHSGITWGPPAHVETAYRDVAAVGYDGFETFSRVILQWRDKPGGWRRLVEECGIPTCAGYCHKTWIQEETAESDYREAAREADAVLEAGGSVLVLQAGPAVAGGYSEEQYRQLGGQLEKIGAYCRRNGMAAALHPHTGTAVETRKDIETILDMTDPDLVGFAPDTAQIAKGGGDVIGLMTRYGERLRHVHLKDWNGRYRFGEDGKEIDESGYVNYTPLGKGIMPIREILHQLDRENYTGWITVELDGTRFSSSPLEAARISYDYLTNLLGLF